MEIFIKVTLPIITAIVLWFLKAAKERRTIGLAIFAEMNALSEVAEERKYLLALKEAARELRERAPEDDTGRGTAVKISNDYCRVYASNLEQVGKLDADEAALVVRFYQFVDSVVQDITEGGVIAEGVHDPEVYEGTIVVFEKALDAVQALRMLRESKANQPWHKKLLRLIV
ncbi:hypothetical protein [Pseudomonas putida]